MIRRCQKGHAIRGRNLYRAGTKRRCRKCHNAMQLRSYYRHQAARIEKMRAYRKKHVAR